MTKTNLVLLTGLPAAGKSTVAQRLVRENGFAILSTDDLRQSLFQQTYEELAKDGKRKDEVVRKIIDYSKLQILAAGCDLVIDSTAPTEKFRRRMLELPKDLEQTIKKTILYVSAGEFVRNSRHISRGGSGVALETIQGFWKEPRDGFCGASLYSIYNNSDSDIGKLYRDVTDFYEWLKG
ncbi:ATP-binding protein [Candidatus Pacearchaeota archaeon]|nr:ATP-binding protein [Candidatus Pacearchaeota archaeon]